MNSATLVDLVDLLDELQPWRLEAACRGMGNALFFPEGKATNVAKRICAGCPVRRACKEYARESKSDYGMWAGEMRDPDRRYA